MLCYIEPEQVMPGICGIRLSFVLSQSRSASFQRVPRTSQRILAPGKVYSMSSTTQRSAALSPSAIEHKAQELSTPTTLATAWASPGPAAFDFRSDVVTTPTASMLQAITSTTLLDDVFSEDPTTNSLESLVAKLTGHPAALLVMSGTMGNQLALRTHLTAPPHAVLTDYRSHILTAEAGGVASLSGALVNGIHPQNGHHITLEDVQEHAIVDDEIHGCPTRVISLENTLAGTVLPLKECQRISEWAWAQTPRVAMHLDGARLWEAVAAGHGTLEEYCRCFDSVSLCFSKGLGAPIGSMITGTPSFIKHARWVRKSIGGGTRQAGVVAAPARVAVEETFLGGLLKGSHGKARQVANMWEEMGGRLANPTETNMVWLDLKAAGISKSDFIALALEHRIRTMGGRLVVHYQIGDEAVSRLQNLMKAVLEKSQKKPDGVHHDVQKLELDAKDCP